MIRHGNGEEVTAHAGLPLVVEALRAVRLEEVVEAQLTIAKRQRGFSETEKLEALLLVVAAGGDRIEDIRILAEDQGLGRLLDRELPSPDALLDFLGAFDDPQVWAQRPEDEKSWVPPETGPLRGLCEVNRALVARAAARQTTTATIDHDGTMIEAHKRDALVAYEGTRGSQPLVAVWVEEDLIVGDEFRDGNVPGNKDPLTSVRRAFAALPAWVQQRYFRGDSADYYEPLLKYLVTEQIRFSISADMSPELRGVCVAVPAENWVELAAREREVVHVAELEFTPGNWPKTAAPLRYVGLRITPLQHELFAERGPKYLAVVTNRAEPADAAAPRGDEMSAPDLVRWHWAKAGTIEHVHRSLKDELGAGVLPSQRFGANAAWFRINAITYNLLTLLKRCALPARFRLARPKRLRFEIFNTPARLAVHQSQLIAQLSASRERTEELVLARQRLVATRQALGQSPAPTR
ncbi:MAG: IS1380 family transposase [Candidatus Rokuibacteriota bacterium]